VEPPDDSDIDKVLAEVGQTKGEPASTRKSQETEDSAIDKALAELKQGRLLFNPPSEMKVGTPERVEVRIARDAAEDLGLGLKGRGAPQTENIRAGPFMTVKLTGKEFDITPLSEDDQLVAKDQFTEWSYLVKPLESGMHNLNLSVGVRIKLPGGGEETRFYPVLERAIRVRVDPASSIRQFLEANWQYLATTLVLPLIAWWWKHQRKRK
jgi:hypothetical protein